MKVQIVSFRCILRNQLGKLISSTVNRDVMTISQAHGFLPGLADGLQNLQEGERRQIALRADQAYGFYDPDKVIVRSREELGPVFHIGQEVQVKNRDGIPSSFRVVEITQDRIILDGNHPLAGQDLIFDIEAISARDATLAEIAESDDTPTSAFH